MLFLRINKYISESGITSRRGADKWIAEGRVTINGVVAELGSQAESGDDVRVDGKPITLNSSMFISLLISLWALQVRQKDILKAILLIL